MINDEILFLLSAHGNIAISHWYSNAAICQSIDIHNRWPDIRRSLNLFFPPQKISGYFHFERNSRNQIVLFICI